MLKVSEILRVPPEYRILKKLTTSLTITFKYFNGKVESKIVRPWAFDSQFFPGPRAFDSQFFPGPRAFVHKNFVDPRDARGDGQGKNLTRHKQHLLCKGRLVKIDDVITKKCEECAHAWCQILQNHTFKLQNN